jgi:hypothetical protein
MTANCTYLITFHTYGTWLHGEGVISRVARFLTGAALFDCLFAFCLDSHY